MQSKVLICLLLCLVLMGRAVRIQTHAQSKTKTGTNLGQMRLQQPVGQDMTSRLQQDDDEAAGKHLRFWCAQCSAIAFISN
jgi:hypothetical protein